MKEKKRKFLFLPAFILLSGAVFLFLNTSLFAQSSPQQSLGIALSPPTFELSANRGDTLTNTIRVENLNETPISVSVEKENFTALGEEGAVGLTEEETPFSLASWITVSPQETVIPPKGNTIFTFQIHIPPNAEPGGHFGSLIFQVGGQKPPQQTGAVVAQQLGSLILLKVAGKTKEGANIESFAAEKRFWEYGPVDFTIRIKNTGNVHIRPQGTITITNAFGKEIAKFPVNPKNVLPGAIRKIPVTWHQKSLIGKYTATVSLTYGTKGKILTASTVFWGFPLKVGGVILLGLTIILFLLYKGRRRIKLALKVLFSSGKNK